VAVLKYRTIPRLNRFPFNTLSAERHLAQFRFIVPIASRITGFIGYIPWKQLASRRILGKVLGVLRRRRTLTISTRHFHQIVTKSGLFSALPARFLSRGNSMFLARCNLDCPVPPTGSDSISIGRNYAAKYHKLGHTCLNHVSILTSTAACLWAKCCMLFRQYPRATGSAAKTKSSPPFSPSVRSELLPQRC
jgi:hypothetical protein